MPSSRMELQQFWKAQVQAFRESGQTVSLWCESNGINKSKLRYWIRKEDSVVEGSSEDNQVDWISAVIPASQGRSSLRISIGNTVIEASPDASRELFEIALRVLAAK
ncbi:IS66 family insertion sequence element accessory protein TnpA [Youngiibacter multivorans]|uniref:IS66 family insertion sequence element accessory protein TnpB n=1 Tax=Youngiibacter multivorans TaxID=937251 RepID=A0ABS4G9A5_9CLOT|nr:hypothetical protein [Youngiibacter multivorans]MBP1921002.1 hypothetical protein [Youngiibacter multivorans]